MESLVDRLIDSQLDWRQLIGEANGERWRLERELSETQIKRQELIHELIRTERHHCLTLALMRQVYLNGLRRLNELRAQQQQQQQHHHHHHQHQQADLIDLERLFPALEELVQAHELLFAHLRLRLVEACGRQQPPVGLVGPLGELLRDQFRLGPAQAPAHKMLQAYARFCGHHHDSNRYYKQLMRTDKQFRQFIEQCNKQNACCRQRGIPECNLLVTQRLTKYPLLIEQLIKTSTEEPREEEAALRAALEECKGLLRALDGQLARKESFERLLDIYAHFSPKSTTTHLNNARFTKHDLLQHRRLRQLLHSDGQLRLWSARRRKLVQVLCLILNDIVVFLRLESAPVASLEPREAPAEVPAAPAAAAAAAAEEQLPLGGQCALLNAAYHHYQHLAPGGAEHRQQAAGSSSFSVKYYFANIDNKSSVISLSKLLVREKAAGGDPEPRLYLISSSQRQPEMYELAFVSRRHLASFVHKLKGSIEQHNRRLASCELEEEEEEAERNELEEEEGEDFCRLEAPCLCADEPEPLDELELSDSNETDTSAEEETGGEEPFRLLIEQDLPPSHVEGEQEQEQEQEEHHLSKESGLSERAKDSLDEASAEAAAAPRHKLRAGRRRRQQRPRQVSNQSSSSSEAAHRQAIQLISAEQANHHHHYDTAEEFDSGRGHDDSSSSVSTSSNSLPAAPPSAASEQPVASLGHHDDNPDKGPKGKQTHSSASSEASKCAAAAAVGPNKKACCSANHRKLSTVSTMSSQLKLISKLKSELNLRPGCLGPTAAAAAAAAASHCCCCCSSSSASQQSTLSKQARHQMRRSSFVPEQKLEELRDLRIQLDKDKQEWQAKFDRMQEQLLDERRELDLARERLKRDQQQVANEREQLYRKLDVLKEKGILLSPSHKVIITTPELRNCPHQMDHHHHHHHHQQQQQHSSSIQIQSQSHQQQYLGQRPPLADVAPNNNYLQQRAGSTSLFIEGAKVPLHLAESGNQQQQLQQQQKLAALGLSKVPLIGSPSNSLLAQRFGFGGPKNGASFKLESQVI